MQRPIQQRGMATGDWKPTPGRNGRLGVVGLCHGGSISAELLLHFAATDDATAALAWQRTLECFGRTLRS